MDVSKLQVDGVYSYKQLCELTGAKYVSGKSRILQLTHLSQDGFSRFMNIVKYSHGKYKVLEIYDKPLEIVDGKIRGNSAIYLKYIELIILKYLSCEFDDNEIFFSKRKLWLLLGMINDKYRRIDNSILLSIGKNVITLDDINSFYLRCNNKLNRILKTALSNLGKSKLIDYEERTIICKRLEEDKCVVATAEEREEILKVEYSVLHEFNCGSVSEIIYRKLTEPYYERVKEILYEKHNWVYYYKGYSIVFNHENIEKTIPRLEKNLEDALLGLNNKIVSALNKEASAIYDRQTKKYNDILDQSLYNPFALESLRYVNPLHDNYLEAQKLLTEELIDISREDNKTNMYDILDIEERIYCADDELNSKQINNE